MHLQLFRKCRNNPLLLNSLLFLVGWIYNMINNWFYAFIVIGAESYEHPGTIGQAAEKIPYNLQHPFYPRDSILRLLDGVQLSHDNFLSHADFLYYLVHRQEKRDCTLNLGRHGNAIFGHSIWDAL
jgi:hypothetical protein